MHTSLTPLTPSQFILDEILKVIGILFVVVGNNDYLQFQILIEFEHIHGKMEVLKFQLKANMCHPLGKSFIAITNGSPFSHKWKLDFVDGHMKLKGHNPTPPNQP
jgi:hypothetical protein